MGASAVTLFNKELQVPINQKINEIPGEVSNYDISAKSTPADLEVIKNKILNTLWQWPKIEINYLSNTGYSRYEDTSIRDAQAVLEGGFTYSASTIEILKVAYTINYSGSLDAMRFSNGGGLAIKFLGIASTSTIEIHFYSELRESAELAQHFKNKKKEILDRIKNALKMNSEFLESKKAVFKATIDQVVDEIYNRNRDDESRNALFFN